MSNHEKIVAQEKKIHVPAEVRMSGGPIAQQWGFMEVMLSHTSRNETEGNIKGKRE